MNRRIQTVLVALVLAICSAPSFAVVISSGSNNPFAFTWSFASVAGALTGSGSMTLSGFNSSILTVNVTLNNTSTPASNRLTSFGFGIDPNATGASFSDVADGGMINASLSAIPSLATIEVCAFGGPNCSGGGSGGILGGGSDTFSILLAGTWGSSVSIDPIGFKYQTGLGSFEFTTGTPGTPKVPEPATLGLLGIGLLGAFAVRKRK